MATRVEIEKLLKRKVEKLAEQTIEAVGKETARGARQNFNAVKGEIPADDPNISVYELPIVRENQHSWYKTIVCDGNQVLFVEFGAGQHEQNKTSTVGLVGEKQTELAPRPKGIHSIGGYGKHKGKGDYWFYASETGRTSSNARRIRFSHRSGKYTMLTIGIRPVRALWRAVQVAIRKLEEGWFKTND